MSFPYGAIVAANMLRNKGEKRTPNPPAISTLSDYTTLDSLEFQTAIVKVTEKEGLFTSLSIFERWQNFDSLSDVKKRLFVDEIAPQSSCKKKPTLFELIKDLFLN